jgi:type IV secretion system protein VirD4
VSDYELQISHGLSESVEFSLKHVELTNGGESFIKVGDLRQLVHILTNVADDLGVLDEAAQLGRFEPLRTALTLLRGYGLQTWSLWQDGSQISQHYGADWQTMVNNCRAIQCFGPNTMVAARGMADLVGFEDPLRLLDMDDNEMLLQISGDMPVLARLPSYRSDPAFAGQFDANPFHDPTRPVLRPRVPVPPPPAKPRPPANPAVQDILKMLEDKADD